MFKKKDLAIAVAMALSVSPASLAQTESTQKPQQQKPQQQKLQCFRGCSGHNFGSFNSYSHRDRYCRCRCY